jgi:hypothetical protein
MALQGSAIEKRGGALREPDHAIEARRHATASLGDAIELREGAEVQREDAVEEFFKASREALPGQAIAPWAVRPA